MKKKKTRRGYDLLSDGLLLAGSVEVPPHSGPGIHYRHTALVWYLPSCRSILPKNVTPSLLIPDDCTDDLQWPWVSLFRWGSWQREAVACGWSVWTPIPTSQSCGPSCERTWWPTTLPRRWSLNFTSSTPTNMAGRLSMTMLRRCALRLLHNLHSPLPCMLPTGPSALLV